jgi:hypothetical protein
VYVPLTPNELQQRMLPLLVGHAANAIHAVVARRLAEVDRPVFDAMPI